MPLAASVDGASGVQLTLNELVSCGERTLCEGEPMPVPEGVCPSIAALFGAAQDTAEETETVVFLDDGDEYEA